jgi:hypothetical protein
MKPNAFRIERMLEKLEAALVPPERKVLRVIIDGDDVAKAKKKQEALAEHVASHPEDAGLTVDDFDWIERTVIRPRVLTDG